MSISDIKIKIVSKVLFSYFRIITIRYILPREILMSTTANLGAVACKLLDLLFDYGLEESPILFHIFSNNGCTVYGHVLDCLLSREDNYKKYQCLQIRGCIIDSAPGKSNLYRGAMAITTTLTPRPVFRWFAYYGVLISLFVGYFLRSFLSSLRVIQRKSQIHEILKYDTSDWPQLFMYSKMDKIISYRDIEEVIAYRRSMGRDVDAICWENSEHVAHFRQHEKAYKEQCYLFVEKCLETELRA